MTTVRWAGPEPPPDEAFWTYLAGLIDGEGWIGATRRGKGASFCPRVEVTNTHVEAFNRLALRINFGRIYFEDPRAGARRGKCLARLAFNGRFAIRLLRHVAPYLVIKQKQAEILLNGPLDEADVAELRMQNLRL